MTLAEFLDWDDGTDTRYELFDGQILAMVGSRDFFDTAIDGQYNAALALRQVDAPASVQGQVKKFIDGPVTEADKEEYEKLLKEKYEPRARDGEEDEKNIFEKVKDYFM